MSNYKKKKDVLLVASYEKWKQTTWSSTPKGFISKSKHLWYKSSYPQQLMDGETNESWTRKTYEGDLWGLTGNNSGTVSYCTHGVSSERLQTTKVLKVTACIAATFFDHKLSLLFNAILCRLFFVGFALIRYGIRCARWTKQFSPTQKSTYGHHVHLEVDPNVAYIDDSLPCI